MEQPAAEISVLGRRLWLHVLLFVLTTWSALVSGSIFFADPGVPWLQVPFTPAYLAPAIPFAAALMSILLAHEMGHYLACRRYRVQATLPFFIPAPFMMFGTFGAVIRIRGPIPGRRALFDIAAAGPLAGFAATVAVLLLGAGHGVPVPEELAGGGYFEFGDSLLTHLLLGRLHGTTHLMMDPVFFAGWFGLFLTTLNLFPVGQLDGGHVAYAVSGAVHRWLSWATILLLGGWILVTVWTTRTPSVYSLWFLVLLLMRNRHPRLMPNGGTLGRRRAWLAIALAAIFLLAFLPVPVRYIP